MVYSLSVPAWDEEVLLKKQDKGITSLNSDPGLHHAERRNHQEETRKCEVNS